MFLPSGAMIVGGGRDRIQCFHDRRAARLRVDAARA